MNANLYKLLATGFYQGPKYIESVLDRMAGEVMATSDMSYEVYEAYLNTLTAAKEKMIKYNTATYNFLLAYLHLQAGNICNKESDRYHHFGMAIDGFKTYIHNSRKSDESLYISYWKLADLLDRLNTPWPRIEELLLQAFQVCPSRAESLRDIIVHYYNEDNPRAAFVFSSYCSDYLYGKQPKTDNKWYVDDSFYQWKVLYYHVPISLSIGKLVEAKQWYEKLITCIKRCPSSINTEEITRIKGYERYFNIQKQASSHSPLEVIIS
ncbi:hypothetical protein [Chitinophaga filiformis]|uniref:Uncharacterized protein n=1 Tax=Chitinophaga filiformis TaxID=104663 RepID=A0ABY4HW79_CHIFI|nr:hypothetical protein [Chitinophaga filiformis]UPK68046.1 hypothetical protein MYF79_24140 [Chitinophaga filiformis]